MKELPKEIKNRIIKYASENSETENLSCWEERYAGIIDGATAEALRAMPLMEDSGLLQQAVEHILDMKQKGAGTAVMNNAWDILQKRSDRFNQTLSSYTEGADKKEEANG